MYQDNKLYYSKIGNLKSSLYHDVMHVIIKSKLSNILVLDEKMILNFKNSFDNLIKGTCYDLSFILYENDRDLSYIKESFDKVLCKYFVIELVSEKENYILFKVYYKINRSIYINLSVRNQKLKNFCINHINLFDEINIKYCKNEFIISSMFLYSQKEFSDRCIDILNLISSNEIDGYLLYVNIDYLLYQKPILIDKVKNYKIIIDDLKEKKIKDCFLKFFEPIFQSVLNEKEFFGKWIESKWVYNSKDFLD